jgi:hypothetical protein
LVLPGRIAITRHVCWVTAGARESCDNLSYILPFSDLDYCPSTVASTCLLQVQRSRRPEDARASPPSCAGWGRRAAAVSVSYISGESGGCKRALKLQSCSEHTMPERLDHWSSPWLRLRDDPDRDPMGSAHGKCGDVCGQGISHGSCANLTPLWVPENTFKW